MTNAGRIARCAIACGIALAIGAPSAASQRFVADGSRVWPGTPLVYAVEFDPNRKDPPSVVRIYDALTGVPVRDAYTYDDGGRITSLAVAPDGDLYVVVFDRLGSRLSIVHAGTSVPYETIYSGSQGGFGYVAVAPSGTFALSIDNAVALFAPGASAPSQTIATSIGIHQLAFAPDGTLWCAGLTGNDFGYVRPGDTQFTPVSIPIPFELDGPMLIDRAGNVVIAARGRLWAYTPLGAPAYTVPLFGRPLDIATIALGPDGRRVYVGGSDRPIEAYNFPAGGRPLVAIGRLGSQFAIGRTLH